MSNIFDALSDPIKVHVQLQTPMNGYTGTFAAAANIKRKGSIRGFFRGMSLPILSYGLTNSLFFGVYGNLLNILDADRQDSRQKKMSIFVAGSIGGLAQLIPAVPIDYVKVVLQSQISNGSPTRFKGPLQCAAYIVHTNGLKGIYKGGVPMLCRDCPAFGLYALSYECLSGYLKSRKWTDSVGLFADFVGGGIAGCASWITTMPMDVVKSRYQADLHNKYKGPIDCAVQSYKQEGARVFFRGVLVSCLRAFPVNGVMFLVYTQVIKHLKNT